MLTLKNIIIFLVVWLPMALLGNIVFYINFTSDFSGLYGTLFVFLLTFIALLFRDKIYLAILGARRVDRSTLVFQKIKNATYRLGIGKTVVYSTRKYQNSTFLTGSFGGRYSIVIGENLFTHLTNDEITAIVISTCEKKFLKEFNHRSALGIIFSFWYLPLFFLKRNQGSLRSDLVSGFIQFYLFPLMAAKKRLFKSEVNYAHKNKFLNFRSNIYSAIFKISKLEKSETHNVGIDELVSTIKLFPNTGDELFIPIYDQKEKQMTVKEYLS